MYGDESYPGSVRARRASAWICTNGLGTDNIFEWSLSRTGDLQGSLQSMSGDRGNPGSWVPAPCGGIGTPYCLSADNSTGVLSEIRADGSRMLSDNDVTLTASRLPLNATGFFIVSTARGMTVNPGGSLGTICLGGALGRYVAPGQVGNSGPGGSISLGLDLNGVPQPTGLIAIGAGETWHWQLWHRDSVGGVPVSNFTHGLSIPFE